MSRRDAGGVFECVHVTENVGTGALHCAAHVVVEMLVLVSGSLLALAVSILLADNLFTC